MNKQAAKKRNISSIQVMKTLQVLMQGNYTMEELVKILNENEQGNVFNHSVVSKYINTCRYCGITIPKIHNKYFVSHIPFGMDITDSDFDLINKLQFTAQNNMSAKASKSFEKFLDKISRYSNKRILRIAEKTKDITDTLFEKAIQDKNKVRLMYKNKTIEDCIPLGTTTHKGRTFLNVFVNNKEKTVSIARIAGLEILNEKFKQFDTNTTVIFKLKGALSQKYQLRPNENVITDSRPNYIAIANRGENKDILFSRLLRYQNLCEVEHPKAYRDEMKEIINNTLSNYGV